MRTLLVAALMLAASPALAQTTAPAPAVATQAILIDAARAPAGRTIIDGANWRCEGATCTATGGANQPATRACRRVVARFGAVSAFTYRGAALTAEQLAACNG